MTTSTKQLSILQLLGQTVVRCVVQGENLLRGARYQASGNQPCEIAQGLRSGHISQGEQPATFNFG
jgi:hypothetical protein